MSMIGNAVRDARQGATQITRVIKMGMKGADVSAVQGALNTLINAGISTDGSFGQGTYRAVRNFQATYQLKADGIVGAQTASAMGFAYSGPVTALGGMGAAGSAGQAGANQAVIQFQQALMQTIQSSGLPSSVVDQAVKQVAQNVGQKILPAAQKGANGAIDTAAQVAHNVVNNTANAAQNVYNTAMNTVDGAIDTAQNVGQQLYGLATDLYNTGAQTPIVSGVISEFERTLNGAENIWNQANDIWDGMGGGKSLIN